MKKILLSTLVLTAFSFSIILFQFSCKKQVYADTQTTSIQQSKIIYLKNIYGSGNIDFDHAEIWSANYDGTNQVKINITLPANYVIAIQQPQLSPDRKTMFFDAFQTDGTQPTSSWSIYACNIDGSNVHQVVAPDANNNNNAVTIADAY